MRKEISMKSKFVIKSGINVYQLDEYFTFNGGEVQVKVPEFKSTKTITIDARIKDSDGVIALGLIKDAIDHMHPYSQIELVLPYLPYARQDRRCQIGESLASMVFIDYLNSLKFNNVTVYDVHNELILNKINACSHIMQSTLVYNTFKNVMFYDIDFDECVLLAPDYGALGKINNGYHGFDKIYATKIRDVATGHITDTTINVGNVNITERDILIIDDICDGGRTFIEIAKKLRVEHKVKSIGLYVTHGIFSNGFEVFDGLIDHIYTTDSFYEDGDSSTVTVEKL